MSLSQRNNTLGFINIAADCSIDTHHMCVTKFDHLIMDLAATWDAAAYSSDPAEFDVLKITTAASPSCEQPEVIAIEDDDVHHPTSTAYVYEEGQPLDRVQTQAPASTASQSLPVSTPAPCNTMYAN